jgi:hypothetical protein
MTKEEYLEILKHDVLPWYALFEFYKEKGGILEDEREFERILSIMAENRSTVLGSDGNMKEISPESIYRKFTAHYNEKFGL